MLTVSLIASSLLLPLQKPPESPKAATQATEATPAALAKRDPLPAALVIAPPDVCKARNIHAGFLAEIDVGAADAAGGRIFIMPSPVGDLTISLMPHSVRAEGYRIVVSPKPGVFEDVELPPVATVRGGVRNIPGSRVVGSIVDGDFSAIILMPDGTRYAIEPFGEPGGAHLFYDTADLVDLGGVCGVGDDHDHHHDHHHDHDHDHNHDHGGEPDLGGHGEAGGEGGVADGEGGVAGGATRWAQVAVDVDYPFYLEHGLNPVAVARRVELCFATANAQYDNQVNIEHLITGIVIRKTAASDPYDDGEACTVWPNESGMNWDVQGQWRNSPPQPFARDAVILFTGRSHGSVIGCAMTDSICNENVFRGAYGWVEASWAGITNVPFAGDVLAHELGHMWNASHCDCTSPPSTMNPSATGALTFSPGSISEILSHLSAHPSCFELASTPPVVGCGGGNSAQSCYVVHATPWCSDATCCAVVCAFDPFCCTTTWDSYCVQRATQLCGTCGTGTEPCTMAHATPGCWNATCCASVCSADPFCCDENWDNLCANRAATTCTHGETCAQATPIATNAWTALASQPTFVEASGCGAGATRPQWIRWTAPSAGMMTVQVCGGEFAVAPFSVAVYRGCGGQRIACEVDTTPAAGCWAGPSTSVTVAVGAGDEVRIRIAATSNNTLADSSARITHVAYPACGNPSSGLCLAAQTTPGCADGDCCATVCAVDPFCCDTRWDSWCVNAARSTCGYASGDVNGDGAVNSTDLGILLSGWGVAGAADFNGDGVVNSADLGVLLSNWTP